MKRKEVKNLLNKAKKAGRLLVRVDTPETTLELSKGQGCKDTYWNAIMHCRRSDGLTESTWIDTCSCIEGLGYLLED